jgi:hypothetical protein
MARPLKGADHSRGKLDHLMVCILRPDVIPHYFYKGQPCVHGHLYRHKMHHWCLECAAKIYRNECGANINKIDYSHMGYYHPVISDLPTNLDISQCWILPKNRRSSNDKKPRFSALTYRSPSIDRAESILLSRFFYFYFWGDIGTVIVNRLCSNACCWNPFHLKSTFNQFEFTNTISPFKTKINIDELKNYNEYLHNKGNKVYLNIDPKSFINF